MTSFEDMEKNAKTVFRGKIQILIILLSVLIHVSLNVRRLIFYLGLGNVNKCMDRLQM